MVQDEADSGAEMRNGDSQDEEPDFSDPEGFVDDVDDDELMPDLMASRPKESDGADCLIVVDNVPKVGADRIEKLKNVLKKIFQEYGNICSEELPVDESGKTKGYMFIEYKSAASAQKAVKNANNYKLDKAHTFAVNLFSDFDRFLNISDDWQEPSEEPYVDQGNLKSWLMEPDACDQYSIIHDGGERVSIMLNARPEPLLLESRERWTETYVRWSPLGTFLVTLHNKGIALWGGEDFHRVQKFGHQGVQYVDFSPKENYVVTFAPPTGGGRGASSGEKGKNLIIWETRTGVKKRAFDTDASLPSGRVWPIFKWSQDDKFFGRMSGESVLSVYETPSFGLLDKKSIKVEGMRDFSWSPVTNILAYWVAEKENVPARVVLMEFPSRNEVRVKNLFNVAECKMHWQKGGDYLCVKVDRYSKLRKDVKADDLSRYAGLYVNFEVFHMREKQIPVDSVEIKEQVVAFSWEPSGSKFAIVHGESQTAMNVSFFNVVKSAAGQAPQLVKRFERKSANHLFWSPQGQFVVLAGLRSMNGVLEFIDTSDFTSMNSAEHFMCTDIEWDPTGRFLVTGVSWWAHKVDNAYWIWSFQGKILRRVQTERFCQFLWRPRPPSLLDKKQLKEIKKNLKKYSVEFEAKDIMRLSKASKELVEKRRKQYNDFMTYRKEKEAEREANAEKLRLLRAKEGDHEEEKSADDDLAEEVVEFIVKEESTIVD